MNFSSSSSVPDEIMKTLNPEVDVSERENMFRQILSKYFPTSRKTLKNDSLNNEKVVAKETSSYWFFDFLSHCIPTAIILAHLESTLSRAFLDTVMIYCYKVNNRIAD